MAALAHRISVTVKGSRRDSRPGRARARRQEPSQVSESWLRVAGVWCIAAKLLLVSLAIDPLGADAFAVPKSVASRGLLYMVAALAALYIVRRRPLFPMSSLSFTALAVVAASGVATVLALDTTAALYGAHRRDLGLTSVVDGAALAAAIALFIRTRTDLITVGGAAALALALTTGYGILQVLRRDPLSWSDPSGASFLGNSTSLAGYLVIMGATLFGAILILWSGLRRTAQALLLGLVAASAVLAVATGARAPTLSLVAAMTFAALIARRAGSPVVQLRRETVAFAAVALVLAGTVFVLGSGGERLLRLSSGQDTSATERSIIYITAVKGFLSRPLFGVGPDGMGAVWYALRPAETARSPFLAAAQTSTHSWLLHQALGTGVAGLAAFLAMVGLALVHGWRRAGTSGGLAASLGAIGVFAYLAQGLLTINSVVPDMLLWASIGLVGTRADLVSGGDTKEQRHRHPRDAWPALAAVTVGLVLAVTGMNVLEANRAVRASDLARAAGNLQLAERAATVAVQKDPGRADPWNILGLAYSRRQPEQAIGAFARAVQQAPRDPVYMINLAAEEAFIAERDKARREAALRHAEMATQMDPHGTETLLRAAEVFAFVDRIDLALSATQRVIDFVPDDPSARRWFAELLGRSGRPADAIEQLERAVLLEGVSSMASASQETRLRLAALYAQVGERDHARTLVVPPAADSADLTCTPANGFAAIAPRGPVRPRCIRVHFRIEAPLLADVAASGSAVDARSYLLDGHPLPPGSEIRHDGERIAIIQLPASVVPAVPGARLTVRSVRDIYGNVQQPDPVEITLP